MHLRSGMKPREASENWATTIAVDFLRISVVNAMMHMHMEMHLICATVGVLLNPSILIRESLFRCARQSRYRVYRTKDEPAEAEEGRRKAERGTE